VRLFEVRLHEGQKRKDVPFEKAGAEHYAHVAERALTALKGEKRYDDPPPEGAEVATEDAIPPTRALEVDDVVRAGSSLLIKFHAGAARDHDKALAMSEDRHDVDLLGLAPSRGYRAMLVLPSQGDLGVLAVEDVARACPRDMVVKWLNAQVKRDAVSSGSTSWRISIKPMTDLDQLARLDRKSVERVEFRKHGIDRDGTTGQTGLAVTVSSGIDRSLGAKIKAKAKGWLGQTDVTDKLAARELAVLVGHNLEEVDFDDAWVVMSDEDVSMSKISPSRATDVFIYRIADTVPTDTAFARAAGDIARRLMKARELSIEWPDW